MLNLLEYGVRSCIFEIPVKMGPCGHILEHSYLALQGKGRPAPILLFFKVRLHILSYPLKKGYNVHTKLTKQNKR